MSRNTSFATADYMPTAPSEPTHADVPTAPVEQGVSAKECLVLFLVSLFFFVK